MQSLSTAILCRDCGGPSKSAERCEFCGGPRLLAHPELAGLTIAHVDCDAFYAAIEKRDDPSLADRPVIVGGGRRGVVATACYIARIHGVHSAMPMFKALKACPDAVVIRPDMEKYAAVGRAVRAMMERLTPLVQPISIDEAFLDLSGTQRLHAAPPAAVLVRFQSAVEREIGISVSIGLSHNKFLAKIASDRDKPRGFSVIGREETTAFLAHQPVSTIWGVGRAFQDRLAKDGIRTIGQIQRIAESDLVRRYGTMGLRLARLSRGEDARTVSPERAMKSVSSETTFNTDLAALDDLLPHLRRLSERVSERMKPKGITGRTVVLKLKTDGFRIRTRNARLPASTNLADKIYSAGRELLRRETDGTKYRLVGIGLTDLEAGPGETAADLLDEDGARRAKAEAAIDAVRARFGRQGLGLGITFSPTPRRPR